eukprot:365676-Chlamydomonas_euryale.AAC.7
MWRDSHFTAACGNSGGPGRSQLNDPPWPNANTGTSAAPRFSAARTKPRRERRNASSLSLSMCRHSCGRARKRGASEVRAEGHAMWREDKTATTWLTLSMCMPSSRRPRANWGQRGTQRGGKTGTRRCGWPRGRGPEGVGGLGGRGPESVGGLGGQGPAGVGGLVGQGPAGVGGLGGAGTRRCGRPSGAGARKCGWPSGTGTRRCGWPRGRGPESVGGLVGQGPTGVGGLVGRGPKGVGGLVGRGPEGVGFTLMILSSWPLLLNIDLHFGPSQCIL